MKIGVKDQGSGVGERLEDIILKVINLPIRFVPSWIGAIGAGVFIALVTERNPEFCERLKELKGRVFYFEARDIDKSFYMMIREDGISIQPHYRGKVDVTMKGEAKTLFALLLGREDPDTVFFSRRLAISGDTAAAVHFKNILNSL